MIRNYPSRIKDADKYTPIMSPNLSIISPAVGAAKTLTTDIRLKSHPNYSEVMSKLSSVSAFTELSSSIQ